MNFTFNFPFLIKVK